MTQSPGEIAGPFRPPEANRYRCFLPDLTGFTGTPPAGDPAITAGDRELSIYLCLRTGRKATGRQAAGREAAQQNGRQGRPLGQAVELDVLVLGVRPTTDDGSLGTKGLVKPGAVGAVQSGDPCLAGGSEAKVLTRCDLAEIRRRTIRQLWRSGPG